MWFFNYFFLTIAGAHSFMKSSTLTEKNQIHPEPFVCVRVINKL